MISQSGDVSPSPVPLTGSLLLTLSVHVRPEPGTQLSASVYSTSTSTILWFGGHNVGGSTDTVEITGGGFVIVTLAVMELLLVSGSKVDVATFAVLLVTVPLGTAQSTFSTSANAALERLGSDGLVHVIVPVWPDDGVVQVQPSGALMDW